MSTGFLSSTVCPNFLTPPFSTSWSISSWYLGLPPPLCNFFFVGTLWGLPIMYPQCFTFVVVLSTLFSPCTFFFCSHRCPSVWLLASPPFPVFRPLLIFHCSHHHACSKLTGPKGGFPPVPSIKNPTTPFALFLHFCGLLRLAVFFF